MGGGLWCPLTQAGLELHYLAPIFFVTLLSLPCDPFLIVFASHLMFTCCLSIFHIFLLSLCIFNFYLFLAAIFLF